MRLLRFARLALVMALALASLPASAQTTGSGALRAQPARVPPAFAPSASTAAPASEPRTVLVAARSLPARSIVTERDVMLARLPASSGALSSPEAAVGLETRGAIPAGRPVRSDDLSEPAVVERNERVTLRFRAGALSISTEGLALDRVGVGRRVRVMNLSSRRTVVGVASGPGVVEVVR
ncbi:MAG: flagellar basal body P-ring formation chaperone FlgA [Pseudomonadota bacterium]